MHPFANCKCLRLLTWNVNGLHARLTDLHSYIITHRPDIIALQEVGPRVSPLRGYDSYVLDGATGSTRGMATYVKQGLPVAFEEMGTHGGIEFITVSMNYFGDKLFFVSTYVHAGALNIDNFPNYVHEEPTVLAGDLNSRHRDLGSHRTNNVNGIRWKAFLDATEMAVLTGDNVPTHIQGGRLDYVTLFNMPTFTAETLIIRCLLSDHFALETTIPIQPAPVVPRKRLTVPTARMPHLITTVEAWYGATKGTFSDAAALYEGLVDTIELFVGAGRAPRRSIRDCPQTYAKDPAVVNCQRLLASYQRRWQEDLTDLAARDAMVAVAKHLTELRKEARSRHWNDFLGSVRKTRSLREVWHHVNRVRGKTRRPVSDPDPAGRAQDLIRQWRQASSLADLPALHQADLARHRSRRMALVQHHVGLLDDTCVPFTHDELLCAVKRGQSTAPGQDGLTYNVLNALLTMENNNPLLDLFNMSFDEGRLPPPWKAALIVPIPKGDGTYRPISLTSCVCKMMERVVLNRLLYKISDQLSPNMHGFMKGRSSSDCFLKCLSDVKVTCRAFVDLKGAFDRANKDVIMEELVLKGVRGKLLRWIRDYLYERKAKVVFQGVTSTEEVFEVGTPQDGVLSPMLFNVLMDKIARWPFPGDTQVTIYADDILVQCSSPVLLGQALQQLSALCVQMGLVINETKTKFQALGRRVHHPPAINNTPIARVSSYKYLGAIVSFKKTVQTVNYVHTICLPRLAPLRVLANRGLGVGVPVLRMFYISVIRSIIDYAAPVLVQFSAAQLRPLELIQNEAMRIILGCPRTTKLEVMRAELDLPSVVVRVSEMTCRTASRLLQADAVPLKQTLVTLHSDSRAPATPFLRKLYTLLTDSGVLEACLGLVHSLPQPTWHPSRVSVDIEKLALPKRDWFPHILQDHFMTKLSNYPRVRAVHIFCDGSVDGSKSGCGVFIRDYVSPTQYTDTEVARRLPGCLSSTRAELYAILESLHAVMALQKDVYLFVDSQAALLELLSPFPTDCDLVNRCLNSIRALEAAGARVHFTWVPSHVGIQHNEKADCLARQALQDNSVDPGTEYTLSFVQTRIKDYFSASIATQLGRCCAHGSTSSVHYVSVANHCAYPYGRHSAAQDAVAMRLRLGYRYYWEVSDSPAVCCTLCAKPGGHTLHHYVMECPSIDNFRPQADLDLPQTICWLLRNDVLPAILKEHPRFAPRW